MSTTLTKALQEPLLSDFDQKRVESQLYRLSLFKENQCCQTPTETRTVAYFHGCWANFPFFMLFLIFFTSVSLDGPEVAPLISGAAVIVMRDQKRCRSINEHMVNKHRHTWNASGSMPLMPLMLLLLLLLPLSRVTFCLISISLLVISSSLV